MSSPLPADFLLHSTVENKDQESYTGKKTNLHSTCVAWFVSRCQTRISGIHSVEVENCLTLQRVEYGEKENKRQVEGSPGEQGEPPGEAEQDDEAGDAAHVRQQSPVGRLVLWVLLLDPGKLDHNRNEDQQAQNKDQEEVGHHAHVEGHVLTQPTATGEQRDVTRAVFL